MYILLIFLITILSALSALIFTFNSITAIFGSALIVSILIIITILFGRLKIRLLIVWNVAFFYIIGFEGLFHSNEMIMNYGSGVIAASKYLVVTFLVSNISCLTLHVLKKKRGKEQKIRDLYKKKEVYNSTLATYLLLTLSYLAYVYLNWDITLNAVLSGRVLDSYQGDFGFIAGIINSVCSTILPAVIAFTFKYIHNSKHYIIQSLIMSLPIIAILFIQGTRFTLLFSIAGLTLVLLGNIKINFKNACILIIVGVLLVFSSEIMLESRTKGIANFIESNEKSLLEDVKEVFYTREGVITANVWLIDYFNENPHLYGVSSSFLLFFWIPRVIWPDKPNMLGYWLIRESNATGFSEFHSVSYGFAGDAYADFGYVGGIIFSLLFGGFLFFLERINNKVSRSPFNIMFIAISFPFTFFALRSFQTASMSFIGMILFLMIFKLTLRIYKK